LRIVRLERDDLACLGLVYDPIIIQVFLSCDRPVQLAKVVF